MSRYETPGALRHDARTLAQDASDLIEATSDIADEKVASARERLADALKRSKTLYSGFQTRAAEKARAADARIRQNPYESIAIALGAGLVLGILLSRRD